ncbi:hypothetical protein BpHYR1_040964 [Brachionus plicatilis]|uniref:Uncharacterized protein n=1 Tax=Brachionus plicatilis TaxID=10195 RepID=A0A3M7S0K7_BRAPC|nr:hypothetical protein BpHYR1_040964 [Brachionus plicatilis]
MFGEKYGAKMTKRRYWAKSVSKRPRIDSVTQEMFESVSKIPKIDSVTQEMFVRNKKKKFFDTLDIFLINLVSIGAILNLLVTNRVFLKKNYKDCIIKAYKN